MELGLRRVNRRLRAAIVVASDTFAEVVGLNFSRGIAEVIARELPVDFIEVVGHQDYGADNARTWGGFHNHLNCTEQEIEIRRDLGGVSGFIKCKRCTIWTVGDILVIGQSPLGGKAGLISEVDEVVGRSKARVGWTGSWAQNYPSVSLGFKRRGIAFTCH